MSMPMVELIAYTEGSLDDASAERFLRACEDHCTAMSWADETAEVFDEVHNDGLHQVGLSYAFAGRDRA
jgi:hypothetical protein